MEQHKIVIAEDETILLRGLTDRFTQEGFAVFPAENGAEALKLALENHPDMILLDIVMPVMDGMTALKKLREDEWGKTAKVIFLTNLSDSDKVSDAVAHGVYDFLIKVDWSLDNLVKRVSGQIQAPPSMP
jgi:DNA-binding response OmpR family regulator